MSTRTAQRFSTPLADNVVPFRLSVLPRHRVLLQKWLSAGRCMGLCDASLYGPSADGPKTSYVLVWVRENADPAYMVFPEGARWVVTDHLRQHHLARVRTFEEALHFIRPVLPMTQAA
ncbi:MAG: hypothetical protein JOY70_06855 [Acidisphaera sp.]|nr:hypothetical protein [Acidisphaera sp.]MBV9811137.1 hypothetical protein [Acetobacteraceae bacterium]